MSSEHSHFGGPLIKESGHYKFTKVETIGAFLLSAAIGVAGTLGVQAVMRSESQGGIKAYEQTYTDAGRCLHDSPYDPSKGAILNENLDSTSGEEIISVLPKAANSYRPSVLFLTEGNNGSLIFADHQTAALLESAKCPDLPSGT